MKEIYIAKNIILFKLKYMKHNYKTNTQWTKIINTTYKKLTINLKNELKTVIDRSK